jgi:DNA-directed RNA polymerase subunit RPC12/RpoP
MQGFAMKSLVCPACSKHLKVKDELAGKRVKCPGCGKGISVPTNGPTSFEASKVPSVVPSAEERTLPPRAPVPPEGATVSALGPRQGAQPSAATAGIGNDNDAEDNLRAHYDFLAPAERPDEIGRLGGFRVLKVLGAGGMGVVFQAEDPKLERKLAI